MLRRTRRPRAHRRRRRRGGCGPSSPCGELELATASRRGEDLSGIRETGRIERGLHTIHRREIVRVELQCLEAVLLHAHAVLASDRAARRDARLEYLAARLLHALQLALV